MQTLGYQIASRICDKKHYHMAVVTLVNVKAPVVATTNWWWLISALVVA